VVKKKKKKKKGSTLINVPRIKASVGGRASGHASDHGSEG